MSKYKLLALDLDGTTLTSKNQISTKNLMWIQRAIESGVTVIFSTGRGVPTAQTLWEEIGLNAPLVLVNGAEIWENPNQLIERTLLTKENMLLLHQTALNHSAEFWGYNLDSRITGEDWTEEMFDMDWLKFGIKHHDLEKITMIRKEIEEWDMFEVTSSAENNIEISPEGITKSTGVKKVCNLLDLKMEQVMAIGDGLNDLHLINDVGLGVAMGNAVEEIKQAADAITDSNDNDGVAKAIKRHLFDMN